MTTKAAKNLDAYYSGSIDDKLRVARQLFQQQGARLLSQQDILDALKGLQQGEAKLNRQMQAMNMGSRCSSCAAGTDGGCCSSFMAGNTDAILLLINLLLGITIDQRNNGDECCYLGPQGCIFIIKPIFCLNYNCGHIKEAATQDEMRDLEMLAGALLGKQTKLEAVILERLEEK
ncbi:MAG TPA: hypothetical protein ENK96_04820 [Desulfobulbaceae bacterium]|nr:hypothetical protein [Desulfobulbaceae bacterium]